MTYQAFYDYQDISDVLLLKMINEQSIYIEDEFIQSAYQYQYLLQINMSVLNGMTLKESK